MVDLSPFKSRINAAAQNTVVDYDDPRAAFINELEAAGFTPPRHLVLGKIDRIDDPQDKKGQRTGWYVYNEFETKDDEAKILGVAVYGSWRGSPERVTWSSRSMNGMSLAEKMEYNRQLEHARIKREEEQAKVHAEVAQKAFEIWNNSPDADNAHPYLVRKQVPALDGVKISRGNLVIPVITGNADESQICGLQFILPAKDETGHDKYFLKGGRKRGCYFKFQGDDTTIFIAEGYATGASVHIATGCSVYIAFDAGNLYEVAAHVKAIHSSSRVVICGDDDIETKGNPGRTKALQAADGLNIAAVFPISGTPDKHYVDFNDLHVAEGLEAVAKCVNTKPTAYKKKKASNDDTNADLYRPSGILGEIVNYYHGTSGIKQPGFAVQTAILICSAILARNFTTNLDNRSSLFLMNIGKSGTGKEHPKKVLEIIMEATGNISLIAGDGYTSGAAVVSALQERPRHVTTIDEFSKYLQAANNKYGNSHLSEANAQLMQAIGRLDGIMRAKSYATIGQTQDRKKSLANQFVINPAITLLAMTTPDDFFQTIDVNAIKDGFLNRFIICVSDVERQIREHKEPLPVPQSIIEWAGLIRERHKDTVEVATEAPKLNTVIFSVDAMALQREFQQWCIDQANALENYGMAEIPARSNEMSMRLALISALSRDPNADIITDQDMAWSIAWVKANLKTLIDRMKMSVASSEHEGHKKEILKALRERGEDGVTWSQMQKQAPFSKHKAKDLREMLSALLDADLAINEPYQSGGKGRPTVLWKAIE